MERFLLDTNILLLYLHGSDLSIDPLFQSFANGSATPLCSVVSEYELLGYPSLTQEEEVSIVSLLTTFRVVDLDRRIMKTAALLRRYYHRKPLDLFVAATALVEGVPLITKNIRDFQNIAGLSVFKELPDSTHRVS